MAVFRINSALGKTKEADGHLYLEEEKNMSNPNPYWKYCFGALGVAIAIMVLNLVITGDVVYLFAVVNGQMSIWQLAMLPSPTGAMAKWLSDTGWVALFLAMVIAPIAGYFGLDWSLRHIV